MRPSPPSSDLSALLIEAPVGRHFAQLHRDGQSLGESVSLFVQTGLRRGNGVVTIAEASHCEILLQRLGEADLDAEQYRRSGQLVILDADEILARFMRRGMPDWLRFRQAIGTVLESVQAFGQSTTRAYGEMVNILWRDGNQLAAIRLEEYWNELARQYPFSLFCSYLLDSHEAGCYGHPIHEIGRTHTDIIAGADDERFRAALDAASRDVFGIPLSQMLSFSGQEDNPGEHRLPGGHRTMLWIMRNMPGSSAEVLERARAYYRQRDGSRSTPERITDPTMHLHGFEAPPAA